MIKMTALTSKNPPRRANSTVFVRFFSSPCPFFIWHQRQTILRSVFLTIFLGFGGLQLQAATFSEITELIVFKDITKIKKGVEYLIEFRKEQKLTADQRLEISISLDEALNTLRIAAKNAAHFGPEDQEFQSRIYDIRESIFYVSSKLSLKSRKIARFAFDSQLMFSESAREYLVIYSENYLAQMEVFLSSKKYEVRVLAAAYLLNQNKDFDLDTIKEALELDKLELRIYEAAIIDKPDFFMAWFEYAGIARSRGSFVNPVILKFMESILPHNFEKDCFHSLFRVVSRTGIGDQKAIRRLADLYKKVKPEVSEKFSKVLLNDLRYAQDLPMATAIETSHESISRIIMRRLQTEGDRDRVNRHLTTPGKFLTQKLANDILRADLDDRKEIIESIVENASLDAAERVLDALLIIGGPDMKSELVQYRGCSEILRRIGK